MVKKFGDIEISRLARGESGEAATNRHAMAEILTPR